MKRQKRIKIIVSCLIIFLLISIPIVIKGRERFSDNWIDKSRIPAILHYNDDTYYEISIEKYNRATEGNNYSFEYTDNYLTIDGRKANLLDYYKPRFLNRRIGETKDRNGNVVYIYVLGFENTANCYKLREEENEK